MNRTDIIYKKETINTTTDEKIYNINISNKTFYKDSQGNHVWE